MEREGKETMVEKEKTKGAKLIFLSTLASDFSFLRP